MITPLVGAAGVEPVDAFPSRNHPGDRAPATVFAIALTGPLSFLLIILMLAGTASVLLGQDPLPDLAWATPLAILVAFGFTRHKLRSTPAELVILGDRAAIRSVWEVAAGRTAMPELLSPPRRTQEGLDVGIGRTVYTLTSSEWADLGSIENALSTAAPPTRSDVW